MNENMDAKRIADIYNINYLVLCEDCPDYILFTEANAIKLIEKVIDYRNNTFTINRK